MSLSANYPNLRPTLLLNFARSARLDPRITFTRSTTAVYYDADTTAVAEQNLLLYSQEFNTGWTTQNATIATNAAVAPDGTTTAESLTDNATNSWHIVYRNTSVSNGVYTISAYLKANTATFGALSANWNNQNQGYGVVVDLSTGAIGSEMSRGGGTGTYTISSAGNSWYRVTITINAVSNIYTLLSTSNSATPTNDYALPTYSGSGSSIYIWGAQVEQRSAATAYTPTTTQPITNYIPVLITAQANSARFDYDPVTRSSLGLLIEGDRTNQLIYSADFTNAAWTNNQLTINNTANIAPDGTQTANKITATTGSLGHFFLQDSTTVIGTVYTQTVYAKAGEYSFLQITSSTGFAGTGTAYQNYNLVTGTLGASAAGNTGGVSTITAVGNGWYRCSFTSTAVGTTARFAIAISPTDGAGRLPTFTGDGYSGIFVWGAQLEAGTFATSYIATGTTTAARTADTAVMTGADFSSWFNPDEGTIYAENRVFGAASPIPVVYNISDGIAAYISNSIRFGLSSTQIEYRVGVGGTETVAENVTTTTVNTNIKSAFAYKVNDFGMTFNGTTPITDSVGVLPNGLNSIAIGSRPTNNFLNGHLRKLIYYPERLSNAQLQTLTKS
jgi:hypothetical protein